ncbi:benzoyl-CoA-dihydrodiol lyase [Bradyrhizobium sp. SSBR45G]|uniref:2,3-epoxybenzoyl-CoA dihydrolase n=1 Tax=unclassified Bradyrhizobium TaxID=2631580 RepID=UPI002342B4F3|nr:MULTISPECIES: 2,3-epoxybenzoyl-CoA dihydrolase [unclassified Bradyrhizobium]GLH77166.1 benzoyl-CoA-dihydrodiol lyase [Bradyrhizobium sp. SSBR45G]GLH83924.1 benzoyl-CoA-dihydrodiol lyase [Bradyrhizobium sp. SSBR45R]
MAAITRKLANGKDFIDFQTEPSRYRHWKLSVDGEVATLAMDVDENAGLYEGYQLKLNSYDLGVDIELADALTRLRFEHPNVRVVLLRSAKDRVFCAGANIRMLAGSEHAHKVNFCKFTNETRNAMEDASEHSGQRFITVIHGTAAGGGYELALATDRIIMVDDGSTAVSLPEVPLLAVLPGTGGLTRVIDKRMVRRDHADVFCTIEEGIKGRRAVQWRLIDELVSPSKLEERVKAAAMELAAQSPRPNPTQGGVKLVALERKFRADGIDYGHIKLDIDAAQRIATITIRAPDGTPPSAAEETVELGARFWPMQIARELDDAILHLRNNAYEVGTIIFKTEGDPAAVRAYDALLDAYHEHWYAHEIRHYWKRVLKRIDLTSRTLVTLIEPGSCFVGTLAELVFAADRSYMLAGRVQGNNRTSAKVELTAANFGCYPMSHGLTRLQSRFLSEPGKICELKQKSGCPIEADEAEALGLVTFALDDIDWSDELRVFREERASFSPDALTGLEANLRFAGPETMESKIFARLTAWQNWIFQRPNAVGEDGALARYGTGIRPAFSMQRV